MVLLSPTHSERELLLNVMLVTCCFTSTEQVALTPLPSFAVTVIVTVPLAFPVTLPDEETVATEELELVQVTDVLLALEGVTVAVRVLDLRL